MKGFCERPRRFTHKKLLKEDLDTVTYKYIMNISKNMRKARSSHLLPLQTDIEETHEALSAVQVRKKQFLLVNDSEKNIVMFSCKPNLQFLSSSDVVYVRRRDIQISTEDFSPTIYNSWTHYVPLAFFLLVSEHQTSYENVFRHTVSEAAKLDVYVFPTNVYADFETAIHNKMTALWPGCEAKKHVVSI